MDYMLLPSANNAHQVFYLPVSPGGHSWMAKVEMRYLNGADLWFLSISNAATGEIYVNQIPVICSEGKLNDLLEPFQWMFQGKGLGSLFCLKAIEKPSSENPGRQNVADFQILWGDSDD